MADQLFPPDESRARCHAVAAGCAAGRARMRPRTLDELVGQEHVLGEGSALRTAIEQGRPFSMVLYGPPGTGKTTLARIVAASADAAFEELSAVNAGKAEVRGVIERAAERRRGGRPTIFFLDEIHRFNKAQQDALLPAVEDGPRHADRGDDGEPVLRGQLRAAQPRADHRAAGARRRPTSRCCCGRAIDRGECGDHAIADEVARVPGLAHRRRRARRAGRAGGRLRDRRRRDHDGRRGGRAAPASRALRQGRRPALRLHLGVIKSMRGSDPDAAMYYLVVMLEGGEDPRFLARRMIVLASEDIGNADPHALPLAIAAAQAVEHVGMPGVQLRAGPVRDVPGARAEVQLHAAGAGRRPRATSPSTAPQLPPRCAAQRGVPGARALGAARATTTRTTAPRRSRRRSCCRTPWPASGSSSSTRPSPSCAIACSGSVRLVTDNGSFTGASGYVCEPR